MCLLALALGHYAPRILRGGWGDDGVGARPPADIPVPPGARRIASDGIASDDRRAFARYFVEKSRPDVESFYRRQMPSRGWTEKPLRRAGLAEYEEVVLSYSNAAGNLCIIAISEDGSGATVAILRLRGLAPENR